MSEIDRISRKVEKLSEKVVAATERLSKARAKLDHASLDLAEDTKGAKERLARMSANLNAAEADLSALEVARESARKKLVEAEAAAVRQCLEDVGVQVGHVQKKREALLTEADRLFKEAFAKAAEAGALSEGVRQLAPRNLEVKRAYEVNQGKLAFWLLQFMSEPMSLVALKAGLEHPIEVRVQNQGKPLAECYADMHRAYLSGAGLPVDDVAA